MIGILLVSHGDFSKGILDTVNMIIGNTEQIFVISLEYNEGSEDLIKKFQELELELEKFNDILIFVDILGGTPCNSALLKYIDNPKYDIIAGMNLSMILDAMVGDKDIEDIIQIGRESIVDVKEYVVSVTDEFDE